MTYKKNNNALKNDNSITINVNDNIAAMIDILAAHNQRKTSEYLRLVLVPVLINEYALLMQQQHSANNEPMKTAIFKDNK